MRTKDIKSIRKHLFSGLNDEEWAYLRENPLPKTDPSAEQRWVMMLMTKEEFERSIDPNVEDYRRVERARRFADMFEGMGVPIWNAIGGLDTLRM